MQTFAALGLSIVGSLGGLLTASAFLLVGDRLRTRLVPSLISYAVGTLLGAALLGLLPESLKTLSPSAAFGTLLAGIFTFFILEKLVLWRHCHDTEDCLVHRTTAPLVIVGDAFHAFVDGALIAAAVMTSLPLGITTALAIAAHEIPQEVGDVAILLAAGYARGRAFSLNLLAGLAGIAGAGLMLLFAASAPRLLPWVLAFASGNFLYVAMADLIPSLHRGPGHANASDDSAVLQVVLVGAGVATIVLL
ncbi:MAG: ZIP family metal transporter [Vicinamibacterales bacterium]